MRSPLVALCAVCLTGAGEALVSQEKPAARQIAEAVAPLPEGMRDGATVLGYRDGQLVKVREGTNAMICLADRAGDDRFHVACYHKDLDPFMARGRALRAAGKNDAQVDSIRRAEIEAGKLAMPKHATALHSITGPASAYDAETGTLSAEAGHLHVVYVPYATEETVGISAQPSRDRPWLMDPGTPWAHVMMSVRRSAGS